MKGFFAATVTAMFLLSAGDGGGAVIVEGFEDYNVGEQLHGLDGGSSWAGPWDVGTEARRKEVTVVDDGLDYARGEILIDGGDRALQYAFTEGDIDVISTRPMPPRSGTLYMSFLYRDVVDDDPTGTGDDFMQFGLFDDDDNPTVSAINRNGEFQVRYGTPANNSVGSGVQPEVETTYFLVLKAEQTGPAATYDKLTLFVDPASLFEASNAPVAVDGNSGLDLSAIAYFVIRKAFHEPGDTLLVDRFRIAETFVEAVTDSVPTLVWDNDGDGEWSELDGPGRSRWRDPADPGTLVTGLPDETVHAILDAANTATVEVGAAGLPAVGKALRLSVQRGGIAIRDGSTLNVTSTADFAAGTTLELGAGATLAAGDGSIERVFTHGPATIGVHSGTLTLGRVNDGDPGVLAKTGWGTLVLDNTAGSSNLARTRIDVTAGTLSAVGSDPLAGAANVTLLEGTTLRLQNVPVVTPGTGLIESWFGGAALGIDGGSKVGELDLLLGTQGSIDVNPGLLGRLPVDTHTPLNRALSYDTNQMNARSQGITGGDYFAALWHGTMTVAPSGSGAPIEAGTLTLGIASDDGSAFWIDVNPDAGVADWQMIVDNGGVHSEQIRVGSVTLLAAGTYDVAIPFYEKDGEDTIEVRFRQGTFAGTDDQVWNQLTHVLDPGDVQQVGVWGGSNIDVTEMPALELNENASIAVRGRSTLEAITDHDARLGRLEMEEGILTTTGAREGICFSAASVLAANVTAGVDAKVPTTLNDLDGRMHKNVTFAKTGPADLILTGEGAGLDQTTFDVRQGRLVAVGSFGPIGRATVQLDGGRVTLAGEHGKSAADFSGNAVAVRSDGTLVAGSGGAGSTEPVTVTLGNGATRGVDAGNHTLTLQTTDGYTLNVAGELSGSGEVVLAEGTVRITGGVDVAKMTVGNGELTLAGTAIYRAKLNLAGPDVEANVIEVSQAGTLQLGGTLTVVGTGRTDNDLWDNVSCRIVANTSGGTIGDAELGAGYAFEDVVPAAGPTSGAHVGQGVFLTNVRYVPAPASPPPITGVDLELFIAIGGDADGDGKVALDDWDTFRANFGRSGTEWTDGNFDPWNDWVVGLDDWDAFRANFGRSGMKWTDPDALRGRPDAVPEPGTLAMLLAGFLALVGLAGARFNCIYTTLSSRRLP